MPPVHHRLHGDERRGAWNAGRGGRVAATDRRGRLHRPTRRHRTRLGRRHRRRTRPTRARPRVRAGPQPLRGDATPTGCTTSWPTAPPSRRSRCTPVLPVVEGVLDPGLLISSLSSIAIGPGERAQPIHADDQMIPLADPTRPGVQHDVGHHRLHRGERRHPPGPGSHRSDQPPTPSSTTTPSRPRCPRAASWCGWGASGTAAAPTAPTPPRRHRHELLRRLLRQQENQQLGIPLAAVRSFPPRLQELCGFGIDRGRYNRAHRQTGPRHAAARVGRRPPADLGPRLTDRPPGRCCGTAASWSMPVRRATPSPSTR